MAANNDESETENIFTVNTILTEMRAMQAEVLFLNNFSSVC